MRCLPSLFLVVLAMTAVHAEPADTIFLNGNIYTVNEKQPHAEAIAIKMDRIAFVGSNIDAEKFRGDRTRVIDLHGHAVFPGFTDSHCHIFGIGEREMNLNLEGTNTLEDFLAKVPHADFVELSDAGHTAAGDDNDAFSEAVVEFVSR